MIISSGSRNTYRRHFRASNSKGRSYEHDTAACYKSNRRAEIEFEGP